MNKTAKKKIQILQCLRHIPILSSLQFQDYFFSEYGSPEKRVSEILKSLELEGMIESKKRHRKSKVWRLSKKGRQVLQYDLNLIPLTTRKLEHVLGIGTIYLDLYHQNQLESFQFEPSYPFIDEEGIFRRYCPDGLLKWNGQLYLLEYQRTPLQPKRWMEKWKVGLRYFASSYNTFQEIPPILTVCEQPNLIVQTGSERLHVYTGKDILTCLSQVEPYSQIKAQKKN